MTKKYESFYKSFTKKRWEIYYEKHIVPTVRINVTILLNLVFTLELIFYFQLVEKHRSKRGTLSTRIKNAMFSVYKSDLLPYINTNASDKEIVEWKNSEKVKKCYENLHQYMEKIIGKVNPQKRFSVQVAYIKAIVKMMLNPKIYKIKFDETLMKRKVEQYMVC